MRSSPHRIGLLLGLFLLAPLKKEGEGEYIVILHYTGLKENGNALYRRTFKYEIKIIYIDSYIQIFFVL